MKATTLKKAALVAGSLSFLAGSAFSQTAVSGAGGYTTETLLGGGAFNLIGTTLHAPVSVSGTFTSSAADSLTDSAATYALTAGTIYLIEITGGAADGTVIEIDGSQASGDTISGLAGITVDFEDTYNIRAAATISSIFGAANESGLGSAGTDADSDIVWVPNGSGGFNRFYYADGSDAFTPAGWNQIGGGADPANATINYIDALIVQRKAAGNLALVITGMVKTDNTSLPVSEAIGSGFNYFGSAYPVGLTLGNSNLDSFVTSGGTDAASDIVWLPDGAGGYNRVFLADGSDAFTPAGWNQIGGGGSGDATPVTSGFVLQRLAGSGDANGLVTPPAFYASL